MWGRADVQGGWWRRLFLVSDPLRSTYVVVVEGADAGNLKRVAVGHLNHDACDKRKKLARALEGLFRPSSPHAAMMLPAVPGFVTVSDGTLGLTEVETLMRAAASRLPVDRLADADPTSTAPADTP